MPEDRSAEQSKSETSNEAEGGESARRHSVVLEALALERRHYEALGAGMKRQLAVVDGRRRIIERHAPMPPTAGMRRPYRDCEHCWMNAARDTVWPCEDYVDAAADALPEEG